MMNWFRNIGIMILLLLAGRMSAQVPVLDSLCAGAERFYRVDGEMGSTYSWILTPPVGPDEILLSDADTLQVIWNYAPGIYELKVVQHSLNACDADAVFGQVIIFEQAIVAAGPDDQICQGSAYQLVNASSEYTSSVLWTSSGDGTFDNDSSLFATYTPGPNDIIAGTVNLTITGTGLGVNGTCDPSVSTMMLTIIPGVTAYAGADATICEDAIYTVNDATAEYAFNLQWTHNGLGTLANDTTIAPTYTPAFGEAGVVTLWLTATSQGGGICPDATDSLDITITQEIMPLFNAIGPLCQNIPAPELPDTSFNNPSITGTWVPPFIDTSVPGTVNYVFTPDAGQCSSTYEMEITVTSEITPVFDTIGPLCQNTTAPVLPNTSINGVSGSWVPAIIDTSIPGTFTYIFSPDISHPCALEYSIDITIDPEITPDFDQIGPFCLNSIAPDLPDTSLSGVTGTWDPDTINTSVAGNFNFEFTPDAGQCALPVTIEIEITDEISPDFAQIGPLCQNSIPPALPDSSLNGIAGVWSPDTINTSVAGYFIYEFTPDPGQCAQSLSIQLEISEKTAPEFTEIGPLCMYSIAPILPDTSIEGISGTWVPALINTDIAGTFSFEFTPDSGQCALDYTMEIEINSLPVVFAGIDQIIPNGTSTTIGDATATGNGTLTYSWMPDTLLVDPTVLNPTTVNLGETTTFILTVSDENGCENSDEITINITGGALAVNPVASSGEICEGDNIQFYASASGGSGDYTYTWTSDPPGYSSDEENPVLIPTIGTTYIIEVGDGYSTIQDSINIIIHPLPVFECPTYGPVCEGSNMIIFAQQGVFKYENKVISEFNPDTCRQLYHYLYRDQ